MRWSRKSGVVACLLAGAWLSVADVPQARAEDPVAPPAMPGPTVPCADAPPMLRQACLDAERRADAAQRAYALWLADQLAADGDARDLALALFVRRGALLTPDVLAGIADGKAVPPDPVLERWYRKAYAKAGRDGVTWSLLASAWGQMAMPRPADRDAQAVWAKAEPDNLAPLLLALREGEGIDAVFAALPKRSHNRVYWNAVQALAMDAVRRHPPKPEWRDAIPALRDKPLEAYGQELGTAVELPSYRGLLEACTPHAAATDRRAPCRALSIVMQDTSDVLIGRMIGNLLLRLNATDDAGRAAAHAGWRPLFWRQRQLGAHGDARYEAAYRDALRTDPAADEVTLIDSALRAVGADPVPPADWETAVP